VSRRYPELDLLRTLAIVCMVIFHAAYDLHALYQWNIPVFDTAWTIFARLTAGLFLLLVGISFAISASKKGTSKDLWGKQRKRFLVIGGCALLVSVATYGADPESYVRFGILHLIALSMLLLPLVRGLKGWAIIPGILMLGFGIRMQATDVLQPFSMILGFPPPNFVTMDYFPLLPWFGIVLIGYGIGHLLYVRSLVWRKHMPSEMPLVLTWPGRHSLLIYMIHQPIILAMLWFAL